MEEILLALFMGLGNLTMVTGGILWREGDVIGIAWVTFSFGVYYLREILK